MYFGTLMSLKFSEKQQHELTQFKDLWRTHVVFRLFDSKQKLYRFCKLIETKRDRDTIKSIRKSWMPLQLYFALLYLSLPGCLGAWCRRSRTPRLHRCSFHSNAEQFARAVTGIDPRVVPNHCLLLCTVGCRTSLRGLFSDTCTSL